MGIQGCQSNGSIRLFCWIRPLTSRASWGHLWQNSPRLDTDMFVDGTGMEHEAVPPITAGLARTTLPDQCSKNLICTWTKKTGPTMLLLLLRLRFWLRFGLGPTVSTHLLMPATKYTAKYKCQNYQRTHADVCTKHAFPSTQGTHCPRLYISSPTPVHIIWPLCTTANILQYKILQGHFVQKTLKKLQNWTVLQGPCQIRKPISTCILQTLWTWPISGCAVWIQKIFLVELFFKDCTIWFPACL